LIGIVDIAVFFVSNPTKYKLERIQCEKARQQFTHVNNWLQPPYICYSSNHI